MRNLSKKNSYSSTWNYSGQRNFNGIHCSLKEEIAHFTGWNVLTSKRQWVNKNDLRLLSGLKLRESMNTRWHLCKANCLSFTPWSALFPQVLKGQCSYIPAYFLIVKVCNHIPETLTCCCPPCDLLESCELGIHAQNRSCDPTHVTKARILLGLGSFNFNKFFIPNYGFPINPIACTTLPGHKQQWLQIVTPGLVPPQDTERDKGISKWNNALAIKFWKYLHELGKKM